MMSFETVNDKVKKKWLMLTKEQYPNYLVASIRTCPPLAQTLSCRCSHTHTQTCAHTLTHTDTHTSTYIN